MATTLFLLTLAAACFIIALSVPDDRRFSNESAEITDNTRDVDDKHSLQAVGDQGLQASKSKRKISFGGIFRGLKSGNGGFFKGPSGNGGFFKGPSGNGGFFKGPSGTIGFSKDLVFQQVTGLAWVLRWSRMGAQGTIGFSKGSSVKVLTGPSKFVPTTNNKGPTVLGTIKAGNPTVPVTSKGGKPTVPVTSKGEKPMETEKKNKGKPTETEKKNKGKPTETEKKNKGKPTEKEASLGERAGGLVKDVGKNILMAGTAGAAQATGSLLASAAMNTIFNSNNEETEQNNKVGPEPEENLDDNDDAEYEEDRK